MEQLSGNSNAGRGAAEGHSPAAVTTSRRKYLHFYNPHLRYLHIKHCLGITTFPWCDVPSVTRVTDVTAMVYTIHSTPYLHLMLLLMSWWAGMCHPKDAIYSIYAHLNCRPLVHHPPVNRENNSRSFDFVQACTLNGWYIQLHCALFFPSKFNVF